MEENINRCNFLYAVVIDSSVNYTPFPVLIKIRIMNKAGSISKWIRAIFNPEKSPTVAASKTISPSPENNALYLQPGEWVQVKSIEEISQTLDEKKNYRGLYFMPEMENFCGKKFKVFKRVEVIKLESTGEVRKLKSPTVFLEGVYCNGERHYRCDRACFHFWKEVWLKRISDKAL
jgi:hypothetical protein